MAAKTAELKKTREPVVSSIVSREDPMRPEQLSDLLNALQAMRRGDFSVRLANVHYGVLGKIADTFNEIVLSNQEMAAQIEKVGQVVGREGKIRQRVKLTLASGAWGEMSSSINTLIDDLLRPTSEVSAPSPPWPRAI